MSWGQLKCERCPLMYRDDRGYIRCRSLGRFLLNCPTAKHKLRGKVLWWLIRLRLYKPKVVAEVVRERERG